MSVPWLFISALFQKTMWGWQSCCIQSLSLLLLIIMCPVALSKCRILRTLHSIQRRNQWPNSPHRAISDPMSNIPHTPRFLIGPICSPVMHDMASQSRWSRQPHSVGWLPVWSPKPSFPFPQWHPYDQTLSRAAWPLGWMMLWLLTHQVYSSQLSRSLP